MGSSAQLLQPSTDRRLGCLSPSESAGTASTRYAGIAVFSGLISECPEDAGNYWTPTCKKTTRYTQQAEGGGMSTKQMHRKNWEDPRRRSHACAPSPKSERPCIFTSSNIVSRSHEFLLASTSPSVPNNQAYGTSCLCHEHKDDRDTRKYACTYDTQSSLLSSPTAEKRSTQPRRRRQAIRHEARSK